MDIDPVFLRLTPELLQARLRADLGAVACLDEERLLMVATRGAGAGASWEPWTGSPLPTPVHAVRVRFMINQVITSFDIDLELLPGIAFPHRAPVVVAVPGAATVDRAAVATATAAWDPRTSTLATFLTALADAHANAGAVGSFARTHADPRTSLRGARRGEGRLHAGGARSRSSSARGRSTA